MDFGGLARRTSKLVTDNSPVILTAIGVTGVVTTAFLTGRATIQAAERIQDHNKDMDINDLWMPSKERAKLVWKCYIPPAVAATLTIAAIICANRVGTRRAAAVAAAYAISEKAWTEYRDKVVETIGKKKDEEVRAAVAQDKVSQNPSEGSQIIVTKDGSVLCYEAFTGRYFLSDMETLRRAENEVNYEVLHHDFATLSDFYDRIGLEHTTLSDDVGWSSDKLLELKTSAVLTETGKPCLVVDFRVMPIHYVSQFK